MGHPAFPSKISGSSLAQNSRDEKKKPRHFWQFRTIRLENLIFPEKAPVPLAESQ
jgi:hypothetical protein